MLKLWFPQSARKLKKKQKPLFTHYRRHLLLEAFIQLNRGIFKQISSRESLLMPPIAKTSTFHRVTETGFSQNYNFLANDVSVREKERKAPRPSVDPLA